MLTVYGRTRSTRKISERKMVNSRLKTIFMQDNATCHTAQTTMLKSCERLAKSPDLIPIENLWYIIEEELKSEKVAPQNLVSVYAQTESS